MAAAFGVNCRFLKGYRRSVESVESSASLEYRRF